MSFAVQAGEVFGLLGSNGAGKTTTVECLEGLRRPDAGEVRVLGVDPLAHPERLRGRVGCQLQESHLPDRMRVWEALDLFAAASPRPVDWTDVLEAWGLSAKRDAAFASLSGGQRQRLLVALALVTDPEVVFLDEMTTGLDPAARHTTWELIEAIRERGTTVVLVTHFMDEAERLCDRIAIMDAGRIVAMGTPAALIEAEAGEVRVKFTAAGAVAARPTALRLARRRPARALGAAPRQHRRGARATDRCSRTSRGRCSRAVWSRRTCASSAPRSRTRFSS